MLGQADGWFSCGELRLIWNDFQCGCGERVFECDLWGPRLRDTLGRSSLDRGGAIELRRRTLRGDWGIEAMARALISARTGRSPLARYAALVADLYERISRATGARVLVDSSKAAADAYLVSALTEVDLYVVHLVRDPRGCAYSWSRRKRFEPGAYIPVRGPARSSAYWLQTNVAIEATLKRRLGGRYTRVRYEDFARSPRATAREILRSIGEPDDELPFSSANRIEVGPGHTVGGNPVRFTTGGLEIRPDDEWRTGMTARPRLLATLPALPLLPHYGYPIAA